MVPSLGGYERLKVYFGVLKRGIFTLYAPIIQHAVWGEEDVEK